MSAIPRLSRRSLAAAVIVALAAVLAGSPARAATIFGPPSTYPAFVPPGSGSHNEPRHGVAADFDNDGIPDLAVIDYNVDLLVIYLTDFIGLLHPTHEYNVFGFHLPSAIASGDLDGDGNADLVIGDSPGQLTVLRGAGGGSFVAAPTLHPAVPDTAGFFQLALRDVNGDGRLDVVAMYGEDDFDDYHLGVFLATGPATFADALDYDLDDDLAADGAFALADFDGDGHLDAAMRGVGNVVRFMKGNADGTFADPVDAGTVSGGLSTCVGPDLDGDGDVDFVYSDGSTGAHWAPGNGDGTFAPPIAIGGTPSGLFVGDFDGDGRLDVATGTAVFTQQPSHAFVLAQSYGYAATDYPLAGADFNQDGRPDIVTAIPNPDQIAVYETTAGPATHAVVTSGNGQSTAVSTAFSLPLALKVLDASNNGVPNLSVLFTPPGGFTASASLNPVSTSTGPAGTASTLATANNTIGCYDVNASIQSLQSPLVYTLCNVGPDHMVIQSGDPQSTLVLTPFATTLSVIVVDGNNNPKSGVHVTFTAPAGAGLPSATLSTPSVTTGPSGVAQVNATANGKAGSYLVTFAAAGMPPATFHLTNTAPPSAAAQIILPLPSQSTLINTAFGSPLTVKLVDSANNPVQGAVISFSPTTAFPSGATASLSATTDVTDAAGIASNVIATANGLVGSYSVKVDVTSNTLVPSKSFTLRNYAGLPYEVVLAAGSPQTTPVTTTFAQHLRVQLLDAYGHPTPQIPVVFFPPASGPGAFLSSGSVMTDANGFAEVTATANGQAGNYLVTAIVFDTTLEQPIFVQFDLSNTQQLGSDIPALSGWGLLALALALAAAALVALRRV